MQERRKIAVAGATGRVGRHTVEVLEAAGHDVVPMSRSTGVDVVTGEGLSEALAGVDCVVDAASWPSSEQGPATEFFIAAARNLQELGERAGVQRIVVVSIIGADRFSTGYIASKVPHERGHAVGPDPGPHPAGGAVPRVRPAVPRVGPAGGRHLRAADAHAAGRREDRRGGSRRARQRIGAAPATTIPEIAGPREERLVDVAKLLVARRGDSVRIEAVSDPDDPEQALYASGALLPGPDAVLAGPTFEQWLDSTA